jgi:hypothetical protein
VHRAIKYFFFAIVVVFAGTYYAAGCNGGDGDGDGNGDGTDGSTVGWIQVGGQVSASDAESEDPVMMASMPKVGYRHASYELSMNIWEATGWGVSKADPSSGNYETFYGPPNFCSEDLTVYTVFAHSGVPPSGQADFYDHVLAYRWDTAEGSWIAMNSGNEISNRWTSGPGGNIWDANEPTIACRGTADPVVAWVEADNASQADNVYVAVVGPQGSIMSPLISRNNDAVVNFRTDVRVAGITLGESSDEEDDGLVYVAQWEHDTSDQTLTDLYVTQLTLPGFTQTNLGGKLDQDYDANILCAPSLAMFGNDLVVAYSAYRPRVAGGDNIKDIYVQRWNGSSWTQMGSIPVAEYNELEHSESNNPDLLVVDDTLYIAWDETTDATPSGTFIFMASWDESSGEWSYEVKDKRISENISTTALDPNLAYDSDNQDIYITFEAMISGHSQIYVMRRR